MSMHETCHIGYNVLQRNLRYIKSKKVNKKSKKVKASFENSAFMKEKLQRGLSE